MSFIFEGEGKKVGDRCINVYVLTCKLYISFHKTVVDHIVFVISGYQCLQINIVQNGVNVDCFVTHIIHATQFN